jgi:hypothetical protein
VIRLTPDDPPFTSAETAKLGWLIARMAKRGIAGEHVYQADLERKVDRIVDGARKRAEQEAKKKK